jgi:hypothetical protein
MAAAIDLCARLPPADEATLREVDARAIAYPLGSGEGEEIALAAGLRPMIRQLLGEADLERERARFERLGLATLIAPRVYAPTHDGWDDTPDPGVVDPRLARQALFIGRDRDAMSEAISADLAKTDEGDRTLGRLLGYPRCCVDAFLSRGKQRKNAHVIEATMKATIGAPQPRLDVLDLAIFHWISWVPCTYRCALSAKYADALAQIVARRHGSFVGAIDEALGVHRLYLFDEVQLSLRGSFDGKKVAIESVWPTARDRHPKATLDHDARQASARLLRLVRSARTLSVDGDAIVLDGARVALSSRPLLAPFGEWKTTHAT